jgi:hypothetical protein
LKSFYLVSIALFLTACSSPRVTQQEDEIERLQSHIESRKVATAKTFKGKVAFSKDEIKKHRTTIDSFISEARSCLHDFKKEHLEFFHSNCRTDDNGKKVCLSKFYGDRRYSKMPGAVRPDGEKLVYLGDALEEAGFPRSYMKEMKNISCIGMAMKCLERAFAVTGMTPTWKKILAYTNANGVDGTATQDALQKLGWKIYYWNPTPGGRKAIVKAAEGWDQEEVKWKSKGYHTWRYYTVTGKNHKYYFNKVDDWTTLVGFDSNVPQKMFEVPFWLGAAHTGYHIFPGTYQHVVEAHSIRPITAENNLEFSIFSPFAQGGGPRWTEDEKYRSGIVAIPPTY